MASHNINNKAKLDLVSKLGIFSLFLLVALFATYFYSPVVKTNAVTGAAGASAWVDSVASISVDPTVVLDITPTAEGKFEKKAFNVRVMSNAETGYKLTMYAEGTDADMTSTTSTDTITSDFSGTVTGTTMAANTWGISKNGTDFLAVPLQANAMTIKDTTTSVADTWDTNTLYLGAKVAAGMKSGSYSKNVVFTAVAYQRPRTMFDITYMHEMTSTICSNTPTATAKTITATTTSLTQAKTGNYIAQTTLTDYRDNKTYLVRKYYNGECWMAQNLEHDFKTSSNAYATNITTKAPKPDDNWIAYSDIMDETTFKASGNAYTGNLWYATQSVPTVQNTNNTSLAWADNGRDGARSFATSAAGSNFKNYVVKTGSTAGDGYYTFQEAGSGEPFQRYGNYYNWAAATAGFLGTATGEQNNSICPRNWQLPANSGDKSFLKLINDHYDQTWTAGANNTRLYNWLNGAPLDFWRAGYYNRSYGSVLGRTTGGYWWSRNASSDQYANFLNTYISSSTGYVYAQGSYYRGVGLSVRCVAR